MFACLVAVAAGLSACSGHPVAAKHAAAAKPVAWTIRPTRVLHWRNCPGPHAPKGLRCTRLLVPLDYTHPHGRTIALALDEFPATAPAGQQLGPLLVNPGGPGGSGLALAVQTARSLPAALAARYTIIGFDPRGVGQSLPALHCDPSFYAGVRPPYQPANKAAEQVLVNRAKAYAAGCERRFGWLLPHMTTADNARDMDAIRAALGASKISYFGISWGTYLGEVYATLFPGHVRRMALDSVVSPAGVWRQDHLAQIPAFQSRFSAFLAWIAQHHAVYRLGSTEAQVAAQYQGAQRKLAAHPIPGKAGPLIGPDELADTLIQAGYHEVLWPVMASALAGYLHGTGTADLVSLYRYLGAANENLGAVYTAVECSDAAWPRDWAQWDADNHRMATVAPLVAWGFAWNNAPCAFWPVHGPARPMKIGAAGLPGILMLQGSLDAATPYAGALEARRELPTARMVVVSGGGNHQQSLEAPPNTCVDGYLARYLATGALPSGSGLVSATCPAPPPPSLNPPASTSPSQGSG